jgi:hypothetical protein
LQKRLGYPPWQLTNGKKALNYPDITLLPTLARTLGVDMNASPLFRYLPALPIFACFTDICLLYRHLPAKGSASEVGKTLRQSLLDQMQTDPEMQFLRDTAGYEKLIEKYKL